MAKNASIEERFFQKVNKTDSCWLWTGARDTAGYGSLTINKKKVRATRWSYEFHKSPIPDGLLICHTCDVPACVNPEHLWAGTYSENALDMVSKNRQGPSKTHCYKGHSYEEVGCYVRIKPLNSARQGGTEWRCCKKCVSDRTKRERKMKKKPAEPLKEYSKWLKQQTRKTGNKI